MFTRKQFLSTSLALVAAALVPAGFGKASSVPLTWRHFPAGSKGFFRAPVLLSGATEAVLIDGGFTYSDGSALAKAIQASGKKLTTVYISQSDPDFYFSLKPIAESFPEARVIAASATLQAIKGNIQKKLDVWGPKLKENGPRTLADIVFPQADDTDRLSVDGEPIEIHKAEKGLANRRYLFVPSLNAVFGGVMVFSGVHVWTADTQTAESRAAWIETLDAIAARKPGVLVPGHLALDAPTGMAAVEFTRSYLLAFEEEIGRASDSAALKSAMQQRFPGLEMGIALDIGAKVAKGEMKWG